MCTQISTQLGMFIFIMMFLPVSQLPNDHVVVKVHNPTLLTCSKPCSGDVKWMLVTRPQILVSDCKRGTCVEGHGFDNRIRHMQAEPSLHLNRVMYNDKGWYICYFNDSKMCQFHLDVVFPHLKSVCVGANVTIPCYADTDKRIPDNNMNIQWEKDRELVLMLQQGKMSYGPGMESRSLITGSQFKNGDLSLTILMVQESDGGIYCCTHRHEEPGQPEAVTLSIRESSECEAIKLSTFPWWGSLLLVVAITACFCIGGLLYRYITHTCVGQKSPQSDIIDFENPMMTGYSDDVS